MTKREILEIHKRCREATPAPWTQAALVEDAPASHVRSSTGAVAACDEVADACFIANAREDIPALLEALSVQRSVESSLRQKVENLNTIVKSLTDELEATRKERVTYYNEYCVDHAIIKDVHGTMADCGLVTPPLDKSPSRWIRKAVKERDTARAKVEQLTKRLELETAARRMALSKLITAGTEAFRAGWDQGYESGFLLGVKVARGEEAAPIGLEDWETCAKCERCGNLTGHEACESVHALEVPERGR